MRILIVTGMWPTENSHGNFVRDQAQGLAALGAEIHVVVIRSRRHRGALSGMPDGGGRITDLPILSVPGRLLGIRVLFVLHERLLAGRLRRAINRMNFPIDAVICHALPFPALAMPRALPAGLPLMVVVHGEHALNLSLHEHAWGSRSFAGLWARAQAVALVGTPLRAFVARLGAPVSKIAVIANGAEQPDGRPSAAVRRSGPALTILSVSNLTATKGVDVNLRALAAIRAERPELDWRYVAIGDGPQRTRLAALCRELHLDDRVAFPGRLDRRATLDWMARADLFSLPSAPEAFGIVYVEAMARGLATIGCRGQGAADIISDGVDGLLVAPGDVQGLKRALLRLVTDADLRHELAAAAAERAAHFTWERNARAVLDVLQQS